MHEQILRPFLEILPFLALGLFLLVEICLIATKGADVFVILFRWVRRKLVRSELQRLIAIPDRLQALVANETLSVGSSIRVVESLPLIHNSEEILLTSREAGATAGSLFYLSGIEKNALAISDQKIFSESDTEPLST